MAQPKPATDDRHDIVIVNSENTVQRFKVDRASGDFKKAPELFDRAKAGGRKARAVAQPSPDFGLGFGIAPTRPEPAAQNGTCIIINQRNVRAKNPWTAARLNNEPDDGDDPNDPLDTPRYDEPLPEDPRDLSFELLIAGKGGRVYHVKCNQEGRCETIPLEKLNNESEIWHQLRNGLVAGSVPHVASGKILPIVNVTSLLKPSKGAAP